MPFSQSILAMVRCETESCVASVPCVTSVTSVTYVPSVLCVLSVFQHPEKHAGGERFAC